MMTVEDLKNVVDAHRFSLLLIQQSISTLPFHHQVILRARAGWPPFSSSMSGGWIAFHLFNGNPTKAAAEEHKACKSVESLLLATVLPHYRLKTLLNEKGDKIYDVLAQMVKCFGYYDQLVISMFLGLPPFLNDWSFEDLSAVISTVDPTLEEDLKRVSKDLMQRLEKLNLL